MEIKNTKFMQDILTYRKRNISFVNCLDLGQASTNGSRTQRQESIVHHSPVVVTAFRCNNFQKPKTRVPLNQRKRSGIIHNMSFIENAMIKHSRFSVEGLKINKKSGRSNWGSERDKAHLLKIAQKPASNKLKKSPSRLHAKHESSQQSKPDPSNTLVGLPAVKYNKKLYFRNIPKRNNNSGNASCIIMGKLPVKEEVSTARVGKNSTCRKPPQQPKGSSVMGRYFLPVLGCQKNSKSKDESQIQSVSVKNSSNTTLQDSTIIGTEYRRKVAYKVWKGQLRNRNLAYGSKFSFQRKMLDLFKSSECEEQSSIDNGNLYKEMKVGKEEPIELRPKLWVEGGFMKLSVPNIALIVPSIEYSY